MRIERALMQEFQYPVKPGTPFDIKYTIDSNKVINLTINIDDGIHMPQSMQISIYGDKNVVRQEFNISTDN